MITLAAPNIISVYGAGGGHLADIAWRPFEEKYVATGGLFICG